MSSVCHWMTKYHQWAWSGSRDPFLTFGFNHIFGIGEAKHFKRHVLIDTEEY